MIFWHNGSRSFLANGGICVAAAPVTSLPDFNKEAAYGQTIVGVNPVFLLGGAIITAGIASTVTSALDDDDDDASD
ncbi:hypothetical protein [Notoacmeibacter ruber]|uniref:Uncharacterized protein n=1 Tax=Notoacmeibacter ruber TaxID=2670375 RepID=A0A3L7JAB9_9HYPH|nr:hypothetical protein [Notoacmeibacter ruber]RLQ87566.1 hypothetical protein D8780_04435 [Notoacmeibacter ruber]